MSTEAGVGISHNHDPVAAGKEAVAAALKQAGGTRCDTVFLFATVGYDQAALLKSVSEAAGGAQVLGCSGEGVIAGDECDESNFAVSVMTFRSDELSFDPFCVEGLSGGVGEVGRRLMEQVNGKVGEDALGLFLFPDGMTFNYDAFVAGASAAAKRPLPIYGGTAGDNWTFTGTYQYFGDRVIKDGIVAGLLHGKGRIVSNVTHGCVPIGTARKITKAQGGAIFEIDGKPIFDVLAEYVDGDPRANWNMVVTSLCLGFRAPEHMKGEYPDYVVRALIAKDDQAGAVIIGSNVEPGTEVWMTRRDHDAVAESVDQMGKRIKSWLGEEQPKLVFHFDCAGRGKMFLRDKQKTDLLKHLRQEVAPSAPWVGFYCYSELAPVAEHNAYHSFTAVVAAIC